jgi:hypothetical protein
MYVPYLSYLSLIVLESTIVYPTNSSNSSAQSEKALSEKIATEKNTENTTIIVLRQSALIFASFQKQKAESPIHFGNSAMFRLRTDLSPQPWFSIDNMVVVVVVGGREITMLKGFLMPYGLYSQLR